MPSQQALLITRPRTAQGNFWAQWLHHQPLAIFTSAQTFPGPGWVHDPNPTPTPAASTTKALLRLQRARPACLSVCLATQTDKINFFFPWCWSIIKAPWGGSQNEGGWDFTSMPGACFSLDLWRSGDFWLCYRRHNSNASWTPEKFCKNLEFYARFVKAKFRGTVFYCYLHWMQSFEDMLFQLA